MTAEKDMKTDNFTDRCRIEVISMSCENEQR